MNRSPETDPYFADYFFPSLRKDEPAEEPKEEPQLTPEQTADYLDAVFFGLAPQGT